MPRAPAMSPDERRAAIVDVTIPLLRDHGAGLTTRQVAEAAGIAEGTLFRAFATKDDLVHACATAAFDNSDAVRQLAAISRDLDLDHRLAEGVAVVQHRIEHIIGLLGALHASGAFPLREGHDLTHGKRRMADPEVDAAFVELIGDDADTLRLPPEDVVNILAHLTLSSAHPMFPVRTMTPAEIVSVVLDGTRKAR